jgi:hypothetical protein
MGRTIKKAIVRVALIVVDRRATRVRQLSNPNARCVERTAKFRGNCISMTIAY